MIYTNGKELIIVWVKTVNSLEFEESDVKRKFNLKITADEYLDKNNY